MTNKEPIPQVDLVPAQNQSSSGPGMRLRNAREEAKLTISEVANQLHIAFRYVEAMERDDYVSTPNRVFVRGYLRAYAKLLNLPEDEILTAFDSLGVVDKQIEASPSVLSAPSRVTLENFTPWIMGVFIIGMGLLCFFWWRSQHSTVENSNFSSFSQEKATNSAALPTIPFTPKLNKLEAAVPSVIPPKPKTPNKITTSPDNLSNQLIQNQRNQQLKPPSPAVTAQPAQPPQLSQPSQTAATVTAPAATAVQQPGQANLQQPNQNATNYKPSQNSIVGPSGMPATPAASAANPVVFPLHNVPNTNTSGTATRTKASNSSNSVGTQQPSVKKARSHKHRNKIGRSSGKHHIVIDSPF